MPELSTVYEIHDDNGHYKFQVGLDRDGLDLVEVRYYNAGETKPSNNMLLNREEARLIAKAILALLKLEHDPPAHPPCCPSEEER